MSVFRGVAQPLFDLIKTTMKREKRNGNNDPQTDMNSLDKQLLDRAGEFSKDENNLSQSEFEATDEDGDMLNEGSSISSISGADLDIPGSELDDKNESIGEEDEENNGYSQADTE